MNYGESCENCGEGVMANARVMSGPCVGRDFLVCTECGITNITE